MPVCAGSDRVSFRNLHDERSLEAQVEKENFHQFNFNFHKEKEMADFRKGLSVCCSRPFARFG